MGISEGEGKMKRKKYNWYAKKGEKMKAYEMIG